MASIRQALIEGVVTKWEGVAALTTVVPGSIHADKVKGNTKQPYARLKVTEGERESTSGFYLLPFKLEISTWSKAGASNASDIADAVADAFDWATDITVTGATVLHCRPLPTNTTTEAQTHDGKDVRLSVGTWELLIYVTG
jgi:hypothetical protein